jgi:hypothetical protein
MLICPILISVDKKSLDYSYFTGIQKKMKGSLEDRKKISLRGMKVLGGVKIQLHSSLISTPG